MILELVLESTFAVADIFFVSKLGASAVATVGLTETYMFLLYSVAMGLSTAITAIVARRIGEKNKEEAGKLAHLLSYFSGLSRPKQSPLESKVSSGFLIFRLPGFT